MDIYSPVVEPAFEYIYITLPFKKEKLFFRLLLLLRSSLSFFHTPFYLSLLYLLLKGFLIYFQVSSAMDTGKWQQEFVIKPMNEIITNTCLKRSNPPPSSAGPVERKAVPEKEQSMNCPRCNSFNTRFAYYNNYTISQPRYQCKDCRRFWTNGGSLRNIPIGGGIRKNKRSCSSSYISLSSSSKKAPFVKNNNTPPPLVPRLNPKFPHEDPYKVPELGFSQGFGCKDLDLAFAQGFGIGLQSITEFRMKNPASLVSTPSALELLGISTAGPPFLMPSTYPNVHDFSITYSGAAASAFGMSYPHLFQEFIRPLSIVGAEGSTDINNGKPLLQFETLSLPLSPSITNSGDEEHDDKNEAAGQPAGYWNGILGAGVSAGFGGMDTV